MVEEERSTAKTVLVIIVAVAVIIALWILIPNIPRLMFPEEDNDDEDKVDLDYDVFEGANITVYKNEHLNVTITHKFGSYWRGKTYEAEWIDVVGESIRVSADDLGDLYDEILGEAQGLFNGQIKWFDYMIHDVLVK